MVMWKVSCIIGTNHFATCWSENKIDKMNDNQKKWAKSIYTISRYTARSCMKQNISVVRYIIHVLGYNYSYHHNHSDIKYNLSLQIHASICHLLLGKSICCDNYTKHPIKFWELSHRPGGGGGGTASLKVGTHCQTTTPSFQGCLPFPFL